MGQVSDARPNVRDQGGVLTRLCGFPIARLINHGRPSANRVYGSVL